jgi:hypothetical protein
MENIRMTEKYKLQQEDIIRDDTKLANRKD